MNIHPIVLHFPIAMLTIYSILELLRFRIFRGQPYWFYIKATLVILGGLSAYVTVLTGVLVSDMIAAEDLSLQPLIQSHEFWAWTSVGIYSILAVCYLIAWIKKDSSFQIWKFLVWLQVLVTETPLVIFLALLGLAALTITGALGGSIAFGHDTDPFTNWIYQIFFH
jgi:uncharacterized membrane protein